MVKIAITPPDITLSSSKEAAAIMRLLQEDGVDYVHLRHPEADASLLRSILLEVHCDLRPRITLHDHPELAADGLAGGVQLNSRNDIIPDCPIRLSRSCHSLDEVREAEEMKIYSYVTLSPIFDSISKPGYYATFDSKLLVRFLSECQLPVIALGGISPDKIPYLQSIGFAGAAMLGHYLPYFR